MNNINFRNEMETLLDEYGVDVLLVRKMKDSRCPCYDSLHRDGDSNCKICLGTGMLSSVEKNKAVIQNANSQNFIRVSELGLLVSNSFVMYFDHSTHLNEGDHVFMVGFDKTNIPVDIKNVCSIKTSKAVRGDNGRIEYYEILAESSPTKIIKEQKRLNKTSIATKRSIMDGGRFVWMAI